MRRTVSLLAAAVLTAAFLCAPPASADATPGRAQQWRQLAVEALTRFETYDHVATGGAPSTGGCGPAYPGVGQRVAAYAWAAEASGRLRGWNDPRTQAYLDKMLSMKNPDGTYGLPCDYDQFNDGTVNPKTTGYTVTMAGHVGATELEAYKATHDPVIGADLHNLVLKIRATPQINTAAGTCLAYTAAAVDQKPAYCVHNVNAGAAYFLLRANEAGQGASGIAAIAANVTRRETAAYSIYSNEWPYADNGRVSDPDHTAYEVESMYFLAPQLAGNIGVAMMNETPTPVQGGDWMAHLRLTALPAPIGGIVTGSPDRWCDLGEKYIAEARAGEQALTGAANATGMAQAAQVLAKTADACAPFDPPVVPTASPTPSLPPTSAVPTSPTSVTPTDSEPPIIG